MVVQPYSFKFDYLRVLRQDELPPLVDRIETGRLAPGRATDEDHVASLKERHAAVGGGYPAGSTSSRDTGRCVCYDPNGPKVDIPVERCISLANKRTVLAQ
jgi:hypothetical protein